MTVFSTARLDVTPWTHDPSDVDRLVDLCSRWEVARWLGATPRALASREEADAVVRPGNDPSMAVCRRLGLTPLGRTDRWYDTELEAFRGTPG